MNEQFIIEVHPPDPEFNRRQDQFLKNIRWFNEHAEELEVFKRHRGQWIAVSEGELFIADSCDAVEYLALASHLDDSPFIKHVPREKIYRFYGNRQLA
ncbi:MAG: hypothetical protein ABI977_33640 [Acidobacteriota bacterium]